VKAILDIAQTIAIVIDGGALIYVVLLVRKAVAELRSLSASGDSVGNSTRPDSRRGRR
jgi:hypothetical protein